MAKKIPNGGGGGAIGEAIWRANPPVFSEIGK
jgi:hypothetical protein